LAKILSNKVENNFSNPKKWIIKIKSGEPARLGAHLKTIQKNLTE
jgi:hypothetical protein